MGFECLFFFLACGHVPQCANPVHFPAVPSVDQMLCASAIHLQPGPSRISLALLCPMPCCPTKYHWPALKSSCSGAPPDCCSRGLAVLFGG